MLVEWVRPRFWELLEFNHDEKLCRSTLIPVHRQQHTNTVRTFTHLLPERLLRITKQRPIHFQPASTSSDPQGSTFPEYLSNSRSTAPEISRLLQNTRRFITGFTKAVC